MRHLWLLASAAAYWASLVRSHHVHATMGPVEAVHTDHPCELCERQRTPIDWDALRVAALRRAAGGST